MPEWLKLVTDSVSQTFSMIEFVDIVDIICVTVVLFFAYKFVRDRRAGRLALGVLLIVGVLAVSEMAELHAMQFIFHNVFQIGLLALVIVFQPELRSLLEKVGGGSIKGLKSIGESKNSDEETEMINQVCQAASDLSKTKTGALIVFEKGTKIGEYAATGTIVNADVNSLLLKNIFYNKAPLHDGAVIIRDRRIYAAGCVLPLTIQDTISRDLGTRHRAAVGMTENSDAVVVVVSEETGRISVAYAGELRVGINELALKETLREHLVTYSVTDVLKAKSRLSKNKNIKVGKHKKKESTND